MKTHFCERLVKYFAWKNYLGQSAGGNCLVNIRGKYPGGNYPGANCPGAVFRGAIVWGAIIRRQLSWGEIVWGAIVLEPKIICEDFTLKHFEICARETAMWNVCLQTFESKCQKLVLLFKKFTNFTGR